VLRRAIELGVDHIDTAQYYGPDVVNDLIRQTLHPYPANLKLVTKVGAWRDATGSVLAAQRPEELREGVEANLRSLRIERLDLVNLRVVGTRTGAAIRLEEQLGALEDLRQAGKLDLIGLSNVNRAQAQLALQLVEVAEIQNGYSIIDRQDEQLLEFARERKIAFVPFFPLGSAFRGGPARLAGEATIVQIADKHGATPAQIALAWLLARYDRMLLIPGTNSVAHLEENMAAIDIQLDADVSPPSTGSNNATPTRRRAPDDVARRRLAMRAARLSSPLSREWASGQAGAAPVGHSHTRRADLRALSSGCLPRFG
jgi:aryl-alcohol dehydrogenase-like predicted oxidoreductase